MSDVSSEFDVPAAQSAPEKFFTAKAATVEAARPASVSNPDPATKKKAKTPEIFDELPKGLRASMELLKKVTAMHCRNSREEAARAKRIDRIGKHFYALQQGLPVLSLPGNFRLSQAGLKHARTLMPRALRGS